MNHSTRAVASRHALWRHLANLMAATTITIIVSALTAWVAINTISGCGEIDPATGVANMDACVLHPGTWR